ncbi:hypothetical protein CDD83_5850 [Cordyceps sp. RAO-2017]|nr:hypothetical protein CDD83_5850 [Cordyceps sp. RAO-2017]
MLLDSYEYQIRRTNRDWHHLMPKARAGRSGGDLILTDYPDELVSSTSAALSDKAGLSSGTDRQAVSVSQDVDSRTNGLYDLDAWQNQCELQDIGGSATLRGELPWSSDSIRGCFGTLTSFNVSTRKTDFKWCFDRTCIEEVLRREPKVGLFDTTISQNARNIPFHRIPSRILSPSTYLSGLQH